MPKAWAYRATGSQAGSAATFAVLIEDGFLCRSAFARTADGKRQFIPHVQHIEPGDDLHLYHSRSGQPAWLGTFRVLPPDTPMAALTNKAPALGVVADGSKLAARLQDVGYSVDPALGSFIGFNLALLDDEAEPPSVPQFKGRNAIAALTEDNQSPGVSTNQAAALRLPAGASIMELRPSPCGTIFGIDWSGARQAGEKIWVAALDPATRTVIEVTRPWKGLGPADAARAVAGWIDGLSSAWIGIDAPFGLASVDRSALIGETAADPRIWSKRFVERYPDRHAFIAAVADQGLVGRHSRVADKVSRSPFAPTLLQMIYQTYAAFQLLGRVDRERVCILPWDHDRTADVALLETCPAVLVKTLGLSNQGYKLKPGSDIRRRMILDEISGWLGWQFDQAILRLVEQDAEGDVLDAILCGMATERAATLDHGALAGEDRVLEEGWIYA